MEFANMLVGFSIGIFPETKTENENCCSVIVHLTIIAKWTCFNKTKQHHHHGI